jgi:hypothetical protein
MGERTEKSLALTFEGDRSRSSCITLMFRFFDVLIDRGFRAEIQKVQDRCASVNRNPIRHRFRSFIQHGQEYASKNCQFPEHIHDVVAVEPALMAVTARVVLDQRFLLAAQHADQGVGKRGQMVEQLTIVHFCEAFGLRRFGLRRFAPTVENLVFVIL